MPKSKSITMTTVYIERPYDGIPFAIYGFIF
jgi:hypothetical protein